MWPESEVRDGGSLTSPMRIDLRIGPIMVQIPSSTLPFFLCLFCLAQAQKRKKHEFSSRQVWIQTPALLFIPAVHPWASHLTSLSLSFLNCKMAEKIAPTSWCCDEESWTPWTISSVPCCMPGTEPGPYQHPLISSAPQLTLQRTEGLRD